MATMEAVKLNNSELKQAVGGGIFGPSAITVYDTRGRVCGLIKGGTLFYWPCRHCGRPTHKGSGLHQCDKCDDWFLHIEDTPYKGTVKQLQEESAAN